MRLCNRTVPLTLVNLARVRKHAFATAFGHSSHDTGVQPTVNQIAD
jgi:hypothetical protein